MYQKMKNVFQSTSKTLRIILLVIYDVCAVCIAEFLALWTRFEFSISYIDKVYAETALKYTLINVVLTIIIFAIFKLYSSLWRYASVQEMLNVVIACFLAASVQSVGMHMLFMNMPRSYYILYLFFLLGLIAVSRFFYRGVRVVRQSFLTERNGNVVNTMIIGAGDTAFSLIQDLNSSWLVHNKVVCVIDMDPKKIGNNILGSPIVGNDSKIPWAAEKYHVQEIFIAIPSLSGVRKKEILEICKNTGCRIKFFQVLHRL